MSDYQNDRKLTVKFEVRMAVNCQVDVYFGVEFICVSFIDPGAMWVKEMDMCILCCQRFDTLWQSMAG